MFDLSCPPPVPPRRPTVRRLHGDEHHDPYAWMADTGSDGVAAAVDAANAHHDRVVAPLAPLTERLAARLRTHLAPDDVSAPDVVGDWAYFDRTTDGQQHCVHLRVPAAALASPGAAPCPDDPAWALCEVVLDENDVVARTGPLAEVGDVVPSDCGRLVAYAVDAEGAERWAVHLLDTTTGTTVPLWDRDVAEVVCFAPDASAVLVVCHDDRWRPHQLWRVPVDGSAPRLVLDEPDEEFALGAARTREGRCALVVAERHGSTRWWVLDLADAGADPFVVLPLCDGATDAPDVWRDPSGRLHLVWVSARMAPTGTLHSASLDLAARRTGAPQLLRGLDPGVHLESVDAFARHLVVSGRRDMLPFVELCGPDGFPVADLRVDDPRDAEVACWWLADDGRFDPPALRVAVSSPVRPAELWSFPLDGAAPTVSWRHLVPGLDPSLYRAARLWADGTDGTAVPVTVVWHRATPLDGTAPCQLTGYGAYGVADDVGFDATALALLDAGVVVATAHVRGGGHGGRPWWDAGRGPYKANTFDDFHAAAHALVAAGYAAPGRVCATGRSAGGLVVGDVVNRADPVFAAVVADVPFVDWLWTMCDPDAPLTAGEWSEWGNPLEDPAAYRRLLALSPYDNAGPRHHRPHLRVTAGANDPRVSFHEPLKWVSRLAGSWPEDRALVLHVGGAGHCGSPGRYDLLDEVAAEQAFVLAALGVPAAALDGALGGAVPA